MMHELTNLKSTGFFARVWDCRPAMQDLRISILFGDRSTQERDFVNDRRLVN